MTKSKTVKGLIFKADKKGFRMIHGKITIRATRDEHGQSLSLADEIGGIMLEIPVEPVLDIIEVKE